MPTLIYFIKEYNTYIVGKKLSLIYNEREREEGREKERGRERILYCERLRAHNYFKSLILSTENVNNILKKCNISEKVKEKEIRYIQTYFFKNNNFFL